MALPGTDLSVDELMRALKWKILNCDDKATSQADDSKCVFPNHLGTPS